LPSLIPKKQSGRTRRSLAAGAGDNIDDRSGGAAVLGGKAVRHQLKLLHRVLREILQRTAHHVVVVIHPVERDVSAASQAPGRRDDHRLCLRGIERGGRRVTRRQKRQLEEVAAIQRKRGNLTRGDDGTDVGADDVHRACGSSDGNLFLDTGDLQHDLQVQDAADFDHQTVQLTVREPRCLDGEFDFARHDIGDGETSRRVRQDFPLEARLTLDHADAGRHALFLGVQHTTPDRPGARLLWGRIRGRPRPDHRRAGAYCFGKALPAERAAVGFEVHPCGRGDLGEGRQR
jgi:hypothetical protein